VAVAARLGQPVGSRIARVPAALAATDSR